MPQEIIRSDGAICYRTKPMEPGQAARFARCLLANRDRFCDVQQHDSSHTRTPKVFITFRPVNRERQGDMYLRQWDARKERAQDEGWDYIFWPDPDRRGLYWCFNPLSGETYEVTCFDCTCPDYRYRCSKAAIQCKHMQAWEMQSEAGRIDKTIPTPAQARRGRVLSNIGKDF